MKGLQNIRNKIKEIYHIHGVKIKYAYQILLMLSAILIINNSVGTISLLSNPVISVLIAFVAGILPQAIGVTLVGMLAIVQVFGISIFVAVICLIILFLVGIMSLRLSPDHNRVGIATFIISSLGGVYSVPLIMGVSSTITGVVPMIGGIISYRVLSLVKQSKNILAEMTYIEATVEFAEVLAADKMLLVLIVVALFTYLSVVYIKLVDADHSWKIGLVIGFGVNIALVFLANILLAVKISILEVVLLSLLGLVVGLIVEFFIHNVDYTATETLQFEDDEYFYYVKAVPKKEKDPAMKVSDSKLGKKSNRKSKNDENVDEDVFENKRSRATRDKKAVAAKESRTQSKENTSNNNKKTTSSKNKSKNKRKR